MLAASKGLPGIQGIPALKVSRADRAGRGAWVLREHRGRVFKVLRAIKVFRAGREIQDRPVLPAPMVSKEHRVSKG